MQLFTIEYIDIKGNDCKIQVKALKEDLPFLVNDLMAFPDVKYIRCAIEHLENGGHNYIMF